MRTTFQYLDGSAGEKIAGGNSLRSVSREKTLIRPRTSSHGIGRMRDRERGFSLIEVVMAIGIISFSMVAVMGLIPVGLTTMQQATDDNMVAQIAKQVSGEVLLTPFSQLRTKYSPTNFYFDDQGIKEDPASDHTRYWVSTSLVNPSYPGSSNAPSATPITDSLATVRVDIVTAASSNAIIRTTNSYNLKVPNSGN